MSKTKLLFPAWKGTRNVGIVQNRSMLEAVSLCCSEVLHASYRKADGYTATDIWVCSKCNEYLLDAVPGMPSSSKYSMRFGTGPEFTRWIAGWIGVDAGRLEVTVEEVEDEDETNWEALL